MITAPTHGTTTVDKVAGSIRFTPEANYSGTDFFEYAISDDGVPLPALSSHARVFITIGAVNDGINAVDDTATTAEDTAVTVDVLANDTDLDGNAIAGSVGITAPPAHGSTTIDPATGKITYTPSQDFNGVDTLTYVVADDGTPPPVTFGTATVTFTVTAVNDAPTIVAPASLAGTQDTPLGVTGISVADVDYAETAGGTLSVSLSVAHGTLSVVGDTLSITGNGSASVTLVGPAAAVNTALATTTYQGDALYYGADSIEVGVDDLGNTGAPGALKASAKIGLNLTATSMVVTELSDAKDGDESGGHVSLREAIDTIGADGVITFAAGLQGTIIIDPLKGPLAIKRSVTLIGPGAETLSISGGDTTRIFTIGDTAKATGLSVEISGLTIADGAAPTGENGGAILNAETLHIANCTISSSTAVSGGGIYTTGAVQVDDSVGRATPPAAWAALRPPAPRAALCWLVAP